MFEYFEGMYGDASTLEHSARGSERAGHKYIDRVFKNGHWRYVYSSKAPKRNSASPKGTPNSHLITGSTRPISSKNSSAPKLYRESVSMVEYASKPRVPKYKPSTPNEKMGAALRRFNNSTSRVNFKK